MARPPDETDYSYLDGLLGLWRADGNPLWIWHVIKNCIERGDPLHADAIEYLNGVASRLLSDDVIKGHDVRKVLRGALGFPPAPGRTGLPLRVGREMVKEEKFAMRFAVEIYNGESPVAARKNACSAKNPREDRTEQTRLRKFFGVSRAPKSNAGWRQIITLWRMKNWIYGERYTQLPPLTNELINEVIDKLPTEKHLAETYIPFVGPFHLSNLKIGR